MIRDFKNWFYISLATMGVCILLIVVIRPTLGIDFTGGSLMEVSLPMETDQAEAVRATRELLTREAGIAAVVQMTLEETLIIRMPPIDVETHQQVVSLLKEAGLAGEELRFESIGPTIGNELRQKAMMATAIAVIVMIGYLTYTFRKASGLISSWKFGVAATYALIYDVLVVMALFVVLGRFWQVPIDTLFMTAMLAIVGYSVNDTVVIFNRFKQEWLALRKAGLPEVIDVALRRSLTRSLYTSATTLLVLVSLLVFGGSTIQWFVVALIAGTIIGTYSSLFVAPPVLGVLAKRVAK